MARVVRKLVEYLKCTAFAKGGTTRLLVDSQSRQLSVITDRVLHVMDNINIEMSILVLLDLSKCLDVVQQELVHKLQLYGILADWLVSYLNGHVQHVRVRSANSYSITSRPRENKSEFSTKHIYFDTHTNYPKSHHPNG